MKEIEEWQEPTARWELLEEEEMFLWELQYQFDDMAAAEE